MRIPTCILASLVMVSLSARAQQPLRVEGLAFSEPATVAEIDSDRMKGQPARLAWSPDASRLYVQMLDGNFGRPGARLSHYVYAADSGKREELQAEPDWASKYWSVKSGQASPDNAAIKIELKSENRTEKSISVPMGGDLARGGADAGATGSSAGDGIAAAYGRQTSLVHSMLLAGEPVGEFVNSVIVPGLTFGWGPRGSQLIAYSAVKGGRLMVMDVKGNKKEVRDTENTLLPAWSPDGTRLAWLQRDGRKKFDLRVARVAAP
ncbi:MAG TPA: hypothetical protein VJ691_15430 [Vicinamibacterales bacterium]|nr:hypothetical protein [Vicinamibacterales bacterium]